MRFISCKLEDLRKMVLPIGYEGENDHTRVQVDAGEVFKEYPAAVPSMKVHGPTGAIYPATVTRDGNSVIWDITASDCAADGSGEAQFTFTNNSVIVKSCIAKIKVYRSIVGGSTPPDPVQDWLDEAQDVLDDLEAAEVHQPMIGVDGYWYTWNQETGEYEETETKAQGEDGQPGPAGQDGAPGQDATPALITVNYSDLTFPVAKDTQCYHDGLLYYAKQDIQTSEAWTAAHWQQTTVEEQQRLLLNAIQGLAPVAVDTVKGAVATFSDGANSLPINHLKVQIVPVQAGTGVPSPTNIRAITGKTGLTVYHSEEDTSDPTTVSVSWQTEAGTVYYGKIDVITGALTVEAIMLTFDGSSDEGWTYNAYNDYNKYRYYINVSSYGVEYGENKQDVLFCNWLRPEVNGAQTTHTYGTNIVCMSPSRQWLFVALDISTVDALKTELATHPLQVVIKLATPSTYNLTPVEIDSLYGVNKFWSDAGNIIQCEYKADTSLFVKDEIDSIEVSPQIEVKANALEDDTIKVIEGLMIRKNLDIEFKAMITDFTSLTIGHGFNEDAAAYIVIDDTNVTAYANSGTQKMQYAHGLTIGTYIRVLIQQDDRALARVSIFTASGKSIKTDVDFNGCVGDIFATVSGELTDVSLIAVLHDINKPIWFFGDSYQAMTKTEGGRWPYYLRDDGYMVNTLFSGKFGAFAQTLVPSFHKLIAIKKPKFVVWCLGLNGSDTNGSLNLQWRDATNDVIATCEEEGITLILATIPNTPDRINTKKNAYVKNTGLRYIDFAKAVGAEEAGSTWYAGMLSSDDLHPSNTGAMALYAQILADLPEVMQNVHRGYEVWEGGSY